MNARPIDHAKVSLPKPLNRRGFYKRPAGCATPHECDHARIFPFCKFQFEDQGEELDHVLHLNTCNRVTPIFVRARQAAYVFAAKSARRAVCVTGVSRRYQEWNGRCRQLKARR
jgi:hypothetical protein